MLLWYATPRADREKTLKALGVFSCQGYNQKHSVPLSRTKAPAHRLVRFLTRDIRKNTPAQAGVFLITHAGISRGALPCSIPRTGYTKKHSSISWSVSGDTRGNLPRAKKQSTGLFFVRCGALPCSIPRTGYTKKHSSISWSVSDDTRGNLPRAKKQSTGLFLCAAAHRPVRFLARDTRKNTPA